MWLLPKELSLLFCALGILWSSHGEVESVHSSEKATTRGTLYRRVQVHQSTWEPQWTSDKARSRAECLAACFQTEGCDSARFDGTCQKSSSESLVESEGGTVVHVNDKVILKKAGEWDSRDEWGGCDVTCGSGTRSASRSCQPTGAVCQTESRGFNPHDVKHEACALEPCVGSWNLWLDWTGCSATCGDGTRTRERSCEPAGFVCESSDGGDMSPVEGASQGCKEDLCVSNWEVWKDWGVCSKECGGGTMARNRECTPGYKCQVQPGLFDTTQDEEGGCNEQLCIGTWEGWKEWRECSKGCGGGIQERSRSCPSNYYCKPNPGDGVADEEEQNCNVEPCTGNWEEWGIFGQCSRTCGGGTKTRTRGCPTGYVCYPVSGGTETGDCNLEACVGEWKSWKAWSPCTKTCGSGRRTRERRCPADHVCEAKNGKRVDKETKNVDCNTQSCVYWSEWSEWNDCAASCGPSTMTRSRECVDGDDCVGDDTETRECDQGSCLACYAEATRLKPWSGTGADVGSASQCQQLCKNDPSCNYYTYSTSGQCHKIYESEDGVTSYNDPGFTSGSKEGC